MNYVYYILLNIIYIYSIHVLFYISLYGMNYLGLSLLVFLYYMLYFRRIILYIMHYGLLSLIIGLDDIKKIIGFSSILHLNIILVCLLLINYISILSGIIISITHGFCSIGLFIIGGLLINKSYSRYMDN